MADEASMEDQVALALDAVLGDSDPELVITTASKPPPDLLEVPEMLRTNALYGGG